MHNFTDLVLERHSVRKYSERTVEREKIEAIIEACRVAPSANNSQPWKVTIVDDSELKQQVAEATCSTVARFNKFAVQAPVIAVITIEKAKLIGQVGAFLKKREYSLIDIGIFAEHFCLKSTELGLGTCMLGWFEEDKIKPLLNIPKSKHIGLLITLGYEAEGSNNSSKSTKKNRKTTEQICSFNSY